MYVQHPQQPLQQQLLQQQQQQQHSFQDRRIRDQSQKLIFQIPNLQESAEEPIVNPGQLFYHNQANQSQMSLLEELED